MHPEDFMKRWSMSRAELATLLGKSTHAVERWFGSGQNTRETPKEVLQRLDELNVRFLQWEIEDKLIPEVRALYEIIRERLNQED